MPESLNPENANDPAGAGAPPSARQRQRTLPAVLKYFVLASALWTTLCLIAELLCRFVLHWGYPYDYPAAPPAVIFGDFRFWVHKFSFFHSRDFYRADASIMYPAPMAAAYKLFLFPQPRHALVPTLTFLAVILVTSWVMLFIFRRGLIHRGLLPRSATLFLLAVYLFSFPFWFVIHQANMEFAVWVLMMTGIWAAYTRRTWVAMVCFGIAGSMKIFPLVFLGIFIARKQFRPVAGALVIFVIANIVALWLLCPDIAYSYQQTAAGLALFRTDHMLTLRDVSGGFDHSLFALIKRVLPPVGPLAMGRILNVYLATAAIGGCILFFTRIRKLPFTNQVLCLTIAAILLPPTSYDYTLIQLYPAFVLLVFFVIDNAADDTPNVRPRGLILCLLLFAFVLSTQSEFILHGVRIAGQLKAVALLLLWIAALSYPFASASEQTEESPSFEDA